MKQQAGSSCSSLTALRSRGAPPAARSGAGEEAARDRRLGRRRRAVHARPSRRTRQAPNTRSQLERAMQSAAREHIEPRARARGEGSARRGAAASTGERVELDSTNRLAAAKVSELEQTIRDRIEATRPQAADRQLRDAGARDGRSRSSIPTTPSCRAQLRQRQPARHPELHRQRRRGINVTLRPDLHGQGRTRSTLEDVTLEQALQQIMWRTAVLQGAEPKTIIVVPDNAQKRTQYDEQVVRDVLHLARRRDGARAALNSIMRIADDAGAADDVAEQDRQHDHRARDGAGGGHHRADHPRQRQAARRSHHRRRRSSRSTASGRSSIGLNLSDYALGADVLAGGRAAQHRRDAGSAPPSPPPFNLNTISQGVSTADFYLAVPTAVVRFLETDSQTKMLAKPQLRGAEGQKLTLNLGDDVPVLQTIFSRRSPAGSPDPAVVVHLPHRRHHRRDDAARDLRRRHHARPVGREQRARAEHQRRRAGRAVVQLAQGDDEAAAARRRVEPARRPAARGRAAQDR